MRAALIRELGQPPEPAEIDDAGDASLQVIAAPLNPIDRTVGSGRFYGGHPELPYVPGCECVARDGDRHVYLFGDGLGVQRNGAIAGRVVPRGATRIEVPPRADPAVAAALGIPGLAAWIPVTRTACVQAGDRVLVLGATGTLGNVALQAAKLRGARVVAAGRDRERLARTRELGAAATVELDAGADLATRMKEACGGDGPTVVIDALWGPPLEAAVEAAAPGARIVNIGSSAGTDATLPTAAIRGKQLHIVGHSNFARSEQELRESYVELVEAATAGKVRIDIQTFPLDRIAEAWSASTKAVVVL